VFAGRTSRILGGTAANFWRLCLATVLLGAWSHGFGNGFGGGAFWLFFLSGCIGFGVGDLALYQALPRVGPRLSALLVHCLAAPFAALTEWLWLGTQLTTAQVFSGAVILSGVAIALAPQEHLHLASKCLAIGVLLGICAALCQGMGAVVSRKAYAVTALAGPRIDGLTAAYQRILGGLLIAAPPSIWIMRKNRLQMRQADNPTAAAPQYKRPTVWTWVLLNSLAGPTLGVACYQWALETTPSGVVLPILAITPIVVIPFAYLIEGDRPGPRSILGGLIAVAGAVALALAR
jgi:drug/metabolite transporter (DMT)-like permease